MTNINLRFALYIACALAVSVSQLGCNGGDEWTAKRPKVYRASGVLKMDGVPLDEATVVYHSQSHDLAAQGITDKVGSFTLTTFNNGDGAVEGKHKVVITKRTYEKKKTKFDSPTEKSEALIPKDLLPIRYSLSTSTDVEVKVVSKGTNNATIEISSK